ncbi:MAG: glycosyltransferase [Dehalococcoidia bacterium]|nr:glycosyltransferase [Dehalococcoidia bacterium]
MLSLIVPTFRERDNIAPLVQRLDDALTGVDYEVVIMDDNSRDGTEELVADLSNSYPVRIVVRTDKRGLASAVVDGFAHARGAIVGVMDADLQHPPEVVPTLLHAIKNGADLAIGSRYVKGGGCEGWSLLRRVMSRGAGFLAHLFLPSTRGIADPMSGFFMFRPTIIQGATLLPTGYKILLEMLVMGRPQHVAEVPFVFVTRTAGESKLRITQQVDYLKHIASLMKRKGELVRFLKYCLVGGSGVFVNMGLLWLLTEVGGLYYLVSAAISIETSIVTNFVLNDYFTFPDRRAKGGKQLLARLAKFNLVSLAGLGLNLGVLWSLTSMVGLHYLLSNLCGIAVATLWNYLVNFWWTWK